MANATITKEAVAKFAKEHNMSEEHAAIVLKEKAKAARSAAKRQETLKKYKHALPETLRHDPADRHHPWKVNIKCVSCGDTSRVVAMQDLFQVKHCTECAKKAKAEKRAAAAEVKKKALEAYKASIVSKK